MFTPHEAASKYCLQAIRVSERCCATLCMMWRWVPSETTHTEQRVVERSMPSSTGDTNFIERVQVSDAPTHGYCGMAGKP